MSGKMVTEKRMVKQGERMKREMSGEKRNRTTEDVKAGLNTVVNMSEGTEKRQSEKEQQQEEEEENERVQIMNQRRERALETD